MEKQRTTNLVTVNTKGLDEIKRTPPPPINNKLPQTDLCINQNPLKAAVDIIHNFTKYHNPLKSKAIVPNGFPPPNPY